MKPKIGYLIDDNAGWDDEPTWHFYSEEDVPEYKIQGHQKGWKRIVYWELDDNE